LILLYTVFVHISANYGFGQTMPGLDAGNEAFDNVAMAIKYEMIGQTFAVIGMGVAKTSLGLFLLRIVVELWHQIAIWVAMVSLMLVSVITAIVFWVQCIPAEKIYDRMRVEGVCQIDVTPFAILLGGRTYNVSLFHPHLADSRSSMVRCRRLFLRHLPLDLHLGLEHEV
jgi:hypothetical protein